ncbi:hypothetical protein H1R20_g5294, partial [Candolleomyces eurysporus]
MKYLCPRLLQKAGYSLRDVLQIPLQNNPKTCKGPLQKTPVMTQSTTALVPTPPQPTNA